MPMTISEVRSLCAAQGLELPELRRAALATDGTPVHTGEVEGVDAFRIWSAVRALHDRTGWWPVLAGPPDELHHVLVGLQPEFAQDIPVDELPDAPELLARWASGAADDFTVSADHLAAHVAAEVDLDRVGGTRISALRQERTVLCLTQARHGHEVPALLNWLGACNYGITGPEHQAVLSHFHELYGAELVTLEGSVLELLITRRPRTPRSVATAALEQYAYCSDVVDQGVGSVEALVEAQLLGGSWYFWWD
ncbi:DUF4253 domain-containing protein [Streptomyces sp. NPDC003635]